MQSPLTHFHDLSSAFQPSRLFHWPKTIQIGTLGCKKGQGRNAASPALTRNGGAHPLDVHWDVRCSQPIWRPVKKTSKAARSSHPEALKPSWTTQVDLKRESATQWAQAATPAGPVRTVAKISTLQLDQRSEK